MTNSQRMRESAVMISSTMPSAKYSCSGSPLILAKGNTAIDGFSGRARAGEPSSASRRWRSAPSPGPLHSAGEGGPRRGSVGMGEGRADPVDPHRPRDVFDLLLAEMLEGEGQPVAYMVIDRVGDEHPAGIGQGFDPRG